MNDLRNIFVISTNTKRSVVFFLTIIILVLSFFYGIAVEAALNKQINYQGKLTTTSNVAVTNGSYNIRFKLYTVPTGGSAIWTETWCYSSDGGSSCSGSGTDNRIPLSNGIFSTMLGSTTSLGSVNFNQTLYLGVEIGGSGTTPVWDGEMTPRKIIGVVPGAVVAETLNGFTSNQFLRSDTVNSTTSAGTFLTITQNGAGNIADFYGPGSSLAFTILSNGKVGVGTTTPWGQLSASSTSSYPTLAIQQNSTGPAAIFLGGNVGIGTSSPYAALSVVGETVSTYFTGTSTTATSTFTNVAVTGRFKLSPVVLVHRDGLQTPFIPTSDTDAARGTALQAARTAAASGDTIYVGPANYSISNSLAKNGVNWDFSAGATVTLADDVSTDGIWDDGGATMSYSVTGSGVFIRSTTDDFLSFDLVKVAASSDVTITADILNAIGGSDGEVSTINSSGTINVSSRLILCSGGNSYGVWWINGEMHVNAKKIYNPDYGVVTSSVTDTPTGDAYVVADEIVGSVLQGFGTHASSALWITAGIMKTLGGRLVSLDGSGKVYIQAQKLFGSIVTLELSNPLLYVESDKISAIVNGSALESSLIDLRGDGTSRITITHLDPNGFTGEMMKFSGSGDTQLYNGDYVSTSASKGLSISGGTLRLVNLKIDTSANSSTNPVTVSGGALTLENSTLKAQGSNNSITAASGQTVTTHGSVANNTVNSNITLSGDLALGANHYFTGNVGIGTSSPYAKLSVVGDLALTAGIYDNNGTRGTSGQILQTTGTGVQWVATSTLGFGSGSGTVGAGTTGQIPYYAANGTTLTATSSLFIASSGNVGVGTTSPIGKLTVTSDGSVNNQFLRIEDTGASGKTFALVNRLNGTAGTFSIFDVTATASRLAIDTNGSVGIGTTTPLQKLHVSGNILSEDTSTTGKVLLGAVSNYPGMWFAGSTVTPSLTNYSFLFDNANSITIFNAPSGGRVDQRVGNAAVTIANATGFAIGGTVPTNKLDVGGGAAIGSGYVSTAAPTNGLIVQGNVGIGSTSPYAKLSVTGDLALTAGIYDNNGTRGSNGQILQTTGTGIQWVATSTLGFASATTTTALTSSLTTNFVSKWNGSAFANSLIFDNGTNVGIGSSSPSSKLVVAGQIVSDNINATSTSATSTFSGGLSVAGSSGLTVLQNGNVYVGTIPSIATKFNVNGNSNFTGTVIVSGLITGNSGLTLSTVPTLTMTGFATEEKVVYTDTDFGSSWSAGMDGTSGKYVISNATTLAGTPRLTIGTTGNVGIGTSSPLAKLSVSSVSQSGTLPLFTVASSTNANLFTILGNGNVGIGTSSPYAKLSVVGDLALTAGIYDNNGTRGTSGQILQTTGTGVQWVATSTLGFGSGSGTVGAGTTGQIPYYAANGTTLTATSSLFISTAGNIGIGTVSPTVKLDIVQDGNTLTTNFSTYSNTASHLSNLTIRRARGTVASKLATQSGDNIGGLNFTGTDFDNNFAVGASFRGVVDGTPASGAIPIRLVFNTSAGGEGDTAVERMRITSTGKVGIGAVSPQATLHVIGDVIVEDLPNENRLFSLTGDTDAADFVGQFGIDDLNLKVDMSSSNFNFTGGNVGINNGSPATKLAVLDYSNPTVFEMAYGGGDRVMMRFYNGVAGYAYMGLDTSGNYTFWDSNATGVRVQFTPSHTMLLQGGASIGGTYYATAPPTDGAIIEGRVGIGTNAPSYKLTVSTSTTNNVAQFLGSGGAQCTVVAGTGWSCTSDERMKENIDPLENSLDKILTLQGVSYNWKEGDTDTTQIGFIAQDVEDIIPELVRTDASGFKSLLYAQTTPYLVEAIKELNLKIENLERGSSTIAMSIENRGILSFLEDKVLKVKEFVTGKLTVGTPEKPSGITLYDEKTGEPYCLSISDGKTKTREGNCENVEIKDDEPTDDNPPDDTPPEEPTDNPSDENPPHEEPTDEPTDEEEPQDTKQETGDSDQESVIQEGGEQSEEAI